MKTLSHSRLRQLLCIFSMLSVSQSALSGSTDIRGGRGGQPFTIACEAGEKIGGFQVRMGKILDGLGIACIPSAASLNGNPIIDGFAGRQGGNDFRYNLGRSRFVKSISFTACKYKKRTVVRSFKVRYLVVGGGRNANGVSETYGTHCDSTRGPVVTHTAPQGQHIYGIIGKSGSAIDSLGAVFRPLPVMGRQATVPLSGIIRVANELVFDRSKIKIDNLGTYGKNGGYIDDGSYLDIVGLPVPIVVPAYSKRRNKGVYRVEYYLDNINSSSILLRRGSQHPSHLKLLVEIESDGRELKGFCRKKVGKKYSLCADNGDVMPDGQLESPRLVMQMLPEVFNGRCNGNSVNSISLTSTASDFYGRIKMAGNWKRVPNFLEKKVKRGIEDRLLNKLLKVMADKSEKALNRRLNSTDVQCTIATPIRDYIVDNVGDIRINAVGIRGNDLVIGY